MGGVPPAGLGAKRTEAISPATRSDGKHNTSGDHATTALRRRPPVARMSVSEIRDPEFANRPARRDPRSRGCYASCSVTAPISHNALMQFMCVDLAADEFRTFDVVELR